MEAKNINIRKLAEMIVEAYSYEELYESAMNGTYEWLKYLEENELIEQANMAGYEI